MTYKSAAGTLCQRRITTEVRRREGNGEESRSRAMRPSRSRRVFAREMERKLGLDGDRTPIVSK